MTGTGRTNSTLTHLDLVLGLFNMVTEQIGLFNLLGVLNKVLCLFCLMIPHIALPCCTVNSHY